MRAESREAAARRARLSVCYSFALLGVVLGVWAARIPAVKADLGLSDGQLSIALFALAAGLVAGMQVAGRLTDRLGSARVMVPAGVVMALGVIPPAFAPDLGWLIPALALWGALNACLDVSMNAHAVEVERLYGRPLMSSFHGMFSVGGLIGAGLGALTAWLDVSIGLTMVMVNVPLAAVAVLVGRWLLPSQPAQPARKAASAAESAAESAEPRRRRALWPAAVVFMGVMAFSGSVGEGAAVDWTAVYLHGDLGASQALAGIGYAVFSACMTIGRFAGDRLAQRFGPVALVRWSGLVAALGLGVTLLVGDLAVALVGFGLFGLGLSTMVPQVFSAAGNHDPARAGEAIAQVATLGYSGLMLGPVIIGGAAELTGLPVALGIPVVLCVFMSASAVSLRPRPRVPVPQD
ncbi:Fucose permease [Sinosporangium album]|uniref:Fucose permease n=1 Tax=Sinosporangium album TaxID=504805 RepID=A0A1G7WQE0_9ACTN|nr:MFS transporter [Sinosporangium album]SDG74171.1 Fucose permease [Sinosporangium album]